jgi:hypothetical protein
MPSFCLPTNDRRVILYKAMQFIYVVLFPFTSAVGGGAQQRRKELPTMKNIKFVR